MTHEQIHLSLVVPVYNSASFIVENVEQVLSFLEQQAFSFEVIAVDDGSRDDARRHLDALAQRRPHLRVLGYAKNRGKGYAIRHGFAAARGRYCIFNDADLAYPVTEVLTILRALEAGADVAVACRVLPQSRYEISPAFFRYLYTRHLMGRFFNCLVRGLLLPGVLDTQAGLKGFSNVVAQRVFAQQRLTGFSFDVEVLYLAKKCGYTIAQVPISFRYFFEETTVKFFDDTLKMIRDLCVIKWNDWRGVYRCDT